MGGHRAFGAGDDLVDGPVDLAAVRADDALLDAIAGGTVSGGVGQGDVFGRPGQDDDHLAAILAAWKADIEAEPMPELVSLDEAADAVEAGHAARDRRASRARRRMPFAVAAAAIAVALSGFTVAVHSAQPGDAMFGLTKVFFSQHADNVAKAEQARATIIEANNAIARGDKATAQSLLQSAGTQIQAVQPEDQPALVQQRQDALKSLDPAGTTPPSSSTATSEPAQQAPAEEGTRTKPQQKPVEPAPEKDTTSGSADPSGTTDGAPPTDQDRSASQPAPVAPTTTTPVSPGN
ncbi:anti-sigma-D factor RsdA [Actinomycetospora termitidis]|uniref:Anti-sigma-D factor RsdA n=1 Tax=Actinomycetospora termitidis TaxID=3053470 RepID=A0ABT7M5H4_9PSEU|nr:anti-sigma-D factor RsdA [Actinomycetospora sp. Odt1-22]MDL5155489.1 anti-sigma-D factor RsdA [Actinomycetospora sp. Odt1-22]